MVETTMDLSELYASSSRRRPDLSRAMVKDFAEALMGAEARVCGAAYGERSPERVNRRKRPEVEVGQVVRSATRPRPPEGPRR